MQQKQPNPHKTVSSFNSILLLLFFILSASATAQIPAEFGDGASELRPLLERFAEDQSNLEWTYNIPMSETDRSRMRRFFIAWQNSLKKIEFEKLTTDGRIDYILFKNLLDYELRSLDHEQKSHEEIVSLIPFWITIVELEENRRKMTTLNSSKVADRLHELHQTIVNIHNSVKADLKEKGKSGSIGVTKIQAMGAAELIQRLLRSLERWFDFYNGYDPIFTWWIEKPYQKVNKALIDYRAFLREKVVGIDTEANDGPIIGEPIGREALVSELEYAMIPYTPEELISIGEKEYAWCENEMIRASRELGYGEDWHAALEYVKSLHRAPGDQPHLIWELAWEAVEFLEKHDLITIPPLARETWKIGMMSPERQKINPFFTGGRIISVSFPTNTMAHEDKLMSMRGNNIHFARATVHHELIPGHHLQFFMASRYKSYRRLFQTPFWLEGWPLHWEMLLWDLGFPKSPENKMGMLFWRIHRCARIIFSLGFHLGKMTPEACIELLVEGVGHELANATAEVRRSFAGGYPPLYQCAYMIGGLQMRALYHELVPTGKMTNREFHDAVLRENSIPIVMLRAKLIKQPLKKNFSADWRFMNN